jgi:hypothetical protein
MDAAAAGSLLQGAPRWSEEKPGEMHQRKIGETRQGFESEAISAVEVERGEVEAVGIVEVERGEVQALGVEVNRVEIEAVQCFSLEVESQKDGGKKAGSEIFADGKSSLVLKDERSS